MILIPLALLVLVLSARFLYDLINDHKPASPKVKLIFALGYISVILTVLYGLFRFIPTLHRLYE